MHAPHHPHRHLPASYQIANSNKKQHLQLQQQQQHSARVVPTSEVGTTTATTTSAPTATPQRVPQSHDVAVEASQSKVLDILLKQGGGMAQQLQPTHSSKLSIVAHTKSDEILTSLETLRRSNGRSRTQPQHQLPPHGATLHAQLNQQQQQGEAFVPFSPDPIANLRESIKYLIAHSRELGQSAHEIVETEYEHVVKIWADPLANTVSSSSSGAGAGAASMKKGVRKGGEREAIVLENYFDRLLAENFKKRQEQERQEQQEQRGVCPDDEKFLMLGHAPASPAKATTQTQPAGSTTHRENSDAKTTPLRSSQQLPLPPSSPQAPLSSTPSAQHRRETKSKMGGPAAPMSMTAASQRDPSEAHEVSVLRKLLRQKETQNETLVSKCDVAYLDAQSARSEARDLEKLATQLSNEDSISKREMARQKHEIAALRKELSELHALRTKESLTMKPADANAERRLAEAKDELAQVYRMVKTEEQRTISLERDLQTALHERADLEDKYLHAVHDNDMKTEELTSLQDSLENARSDVAERDDYIASLVAKLQELLVFTGVTTLHDLWMALDTHWSDVHANYVEGRFLSLHVLPILSQSAQFGSNCTTATAGAGGAAGGPSTSLLLLTPLMVPTNYCPAESPHLARIRRERTHQSSGAALGDEQLLGSPDADGGDPLMASQRRNWILGTAASELLAYRIPEKNLAEHINVKDDGTKGATTSGDTISKLKSVRQENELTDASSGRNRMLRPLGGLDDLMFLPRDVDPLTGYFSSSEQQEDDSAVVNLVSASAAVLERFLHPRYLSPSVVRHGVLHGAALALANSATIRNLRFTVSDAKLFVTAFWSARLSYLVSRVVVYTQQQQSAAGRNKQQHQNSSAAPQSPHSASVSFPHSPHSPTSPHAASDGNSKKPNQAQKPKLLNFCEFLFEHLDKRYPSPPSKHTAAGSGGVNDDSSPNKLPAGMPISKRAREEWLEKQRKHAEEEAVKPIAPLLSNAAQEVLYTVTAVCNDYQRVEPELRLFHMVATQQVPEQLAIDFYANLSILFDGCRTYASENAMDPVSRYVAATNCFSDFAKQTVAATPRNNSNNNNNAAAAIVSPSSNFSPTGGEYTSSSSATGAAAAPQHDSFASSLAALSHTQRGSSEAVHQRRKSLDAAALALQSVASLNTNVSFGGSSGGGALQQSFSVGVSTANLTSPAHSAAAFERTSAGHFAGGFSGGGAAGGVGAGFVRLHPSLLRAAMSIPTHGLTHHGHPSRRHQIQDRSNDTTSPPSHDSEDEGQQDDTGSGKQHQLQQRSLASSMSSTLLLGDFFHVLGQSLFHFYCSPVLREETTTTTTKVNEEHSASSLKVPPGTIINSQKKAGSVKFALDTVGEEKEEKEEGKDEERDKKKDQNYDNSEGSEKKEPLGSSTTIEDTPKQQQQTPTATAIHFDSLQHSRPTPSELSRLQFAVSLETQGPVVDYVGMFKPDPTHHGSPNTRGGYFLSELLSIFVDRYLRYNRAVLRAAEEACTSSLVSARSTGKSQQQQSAASAAASTTLLGAASALRTSNNSSDKQQEQSPQQLATKVLQSLVDVAEFKRRWVEMDPHRCSDIDAVIAGLFEMRRVKRYERIHLNMNESNQQEQPAAHSKTSSRVVVMRTCIPALNHGVRQWAQYQPSKETTLSLLLNPPLLKEVIGKEEAQIGQYNNNDKKNNTALGIAGVGDESDRDGDEADDASWPPPTEPRATTASSSSSSSSYTVLVPQQVSLPLLLSRLRQTYLVRADAYGEEAIEEDDQRDTPLAAPLTQFEAKKLLAMGASGGGGAAGRGRKRRPGASAAGTATAAAAAVQPHPPHQSKHFCVTNAHARAVTTELARNERILTDFHETVNGAIKLSALLSGNPFAPPGGGSGMAGAGGARSRAMSIKGSGGGGSLQQQAARELRSGSVAIFPELLNLSRQQPQGDQSASPTSAARLSLFGTAALVATAATTLRRRQSGKGSMSASLQMSSSQSGMVGDAATADELAMGAANMSFVGFGSPDVSANHKAGGGGAAVATTTPAAPQATTTTSACPPLDVYLHGCLASRGWLSCTYSSGSAGGAGALTTTTLAGGGGGGAGSAAQNGHTLTAYGTLARAVPTRSQLSFDRLFAYSAPPPPLLPSQQPAQQPPQQPSADRKSSSVEEEMRQSLQQLTRALERHDWVSRCELINQVL